MRTLTKNRQGVLALAENPAVKVVIKILVRP
ncbi:hypothetical protein M271_41305 [Streptomyces rapamycinicus NRRL 5491]|uniref:Uncharacterized protein n=2 Tax=Streptomyces rapamycinicus TaxID=1226757 RepID=A0A0A0NT75_STRRN|nr:hypothetical protein M271_41305 [Streptomyces rapamycinicus NRRL 5491]MBB4789209.1 hypothetical protein [Streptomyces rapamycinicus]RLV77178.1 hypothetical protein D3C57_102375 [Streptomyces rapamycinicus NRRL 5491]